ncbi:Uncharacterized protein FKW44_016845 [Caligus rogercresseyi]|uniref:Uncharacterized protein n=1 Tax=Caligus rogercresseyi TaxID=217165 RepID=A0A7T8H2H8_CALRO|nr:Uncharacterized protein FKW44_016845 [Caligus rogercresseyi]
MSMERDIRLGSTRFWMPGKHRQRSRGSWHQQATEYKVKATGIESKVDREDVKQILMADPLKSIRALAADYIEILRTKTSPMGSCATSRIEHPPIRVGESKACKLRPSNIARPKATSTRSGLAWKDFVFEVYQALRKRLMTIVATNGGYIE